MTVLRALLIPSAVVAIGLGCLWGGRAGQALQLVGTVLAGVATVVVLAEI